jgi:dTDP-glucose pyrophosphorylase
MNVLVLMSGSSQAFEDAGFKFPKNLTEIAGQPLVQRVLFPLLPLLSKDAKLICVVQRDENRKHHTGKVLQLIHPSVSLVEIPSATAGAACSALLAVDYIDTEEPLIIYNGDQILEGIDPTEIVSEFMERQLDAGVLVFRDIHPRWSFVRCTGEGMVIETAEKRPISNLATAGFYFFRRGTDFIRATKSMIKKGAHVDGKFFVCPSLNEMILDHARIGIHEIDRNQYRSLSSPVDVTAYESHLLKR